MIGKKFLVINSIYWKRLAVGTILEVLKEYPITIKSNPNVTYTNYFCLCKGPKGGLCHKEIQEMMLKLNCKEIKEDDEHS